MKFSMKLVLSTIIVLALALGFSGFYFVNYVFETSLDREVGQALDESSILSFAFETAALNVPLKYSVLPDSVVEEIASKLEWEARAADAFFGSRMRRKHTVYQQRIYFGRGTASADGSAHQILPRDPRAGRFLCAHLCCRQYVEPNVVSGDHERCDGGVYGACPWVFSVSEGNGGYIIDWNSHHVVYCLPVDEADTPADQGDQKNGGG